MASQGSLLVQKQLRGFTGPIAHANRGDWDWQDDVYQKIQNIKAMCLPALHQIHQIAVWQLEKTATLTTHPHADQTKKIRVFKTNLQHFMKILQLSKSDISPGLKDKWPWYEKIILDCVTLYGGRKPIPSHQNSMTTSSVSLPTRPSIISVQGDAVMSSQSLQTNSGSGNNNSMSSDVSYSSLVPHQHQGKELKQKTQNRKQQFHRETRHKISQEGSEGQKTAYSRQSSKQGSQHQLSSSQQLQAASPLSAVCASPHPDLNNIMSYNVNNGTPSLVSKYPTVVPVKSGHQQTLAPFFALGTQELNNADSSNISSLTVVSGKSTVTEKPMEQLMRAVTSISTDALSSAASDIASVTMMVDRLAGPAPMKSVRCHLNPVTTATSSFKRQRIEDTAPLLKEIREINQQLFDTVVDIVDNKIDPSTVAVASKGTLVTFSTTPVTLSLQLKSHFSAHRLRIQPLRLLVPPCYPNCSPILLDDGSADISSNKDEDLGSKARTRFKLTLRTLSEPKSLKEIARIWEVCVRTVISKYAKQLCRSRCTSGDRAWITCL